MPYTGDHQEIPRRGIRQSVQQRWTKTGAKDGAVHGAPVYLRSDSGPEFVSNAILQWLTDARIETAIIDPGKPWQNGTNESF
jgi:transposase InsO family protein